MSRRRQPSGMFAKGTYEKATPLPAGKPIAPTRTPPAPGHAKFRDIPGQGMLSLDDDQPDEITYKEDQ